MHFVGRQTVKCLRSDNSKELIRTAKTLKALHETSTPYHSESNARIERDIGIVVNGVRANLEQSGLPLSFWPLAGQHWAHYSNCIIPNKGSGSLRDSDPAAITPWRVRFKDEWKGPTAPFGCLIRFRPQNVGESLPKFASRTIEGVFVGVFLQPGHTGRTCSQ